MQPTYIIFAGINGAGKTTESQKEIAAWNNGTLCWWGATSLRGGWLADALLNVPDISLTKHNRY